MRKILTLIGAALVTWTLLIGCSKPPGQREFDSAVDEIQDGNFVRAKALLEKSISKRPGSEQNALAYNYLGIASWRLGKFQEAMDAFEDSRRLSPTLVEPVYNQGVLLAENNDAARATSLLNDAARMDPTDSRPLEYLAQIYMKRQQWPEARRVLYGAIDRAPNSARILTSIALVEAGSGEYEKAVQSLMKALEKNSKYPPALFNLGILYQTQIHDNDQAETYYKKFLSAAKKDDRVPYVKAALEQLSAPSGETVSSVTPAPANTPSNPPEVSTPAPVHKEPVTYDELLKEAAVQADKGQADKALDLCLRAADDAEKAKKPEQQEKALRAATRLCFDQPRGFVELGQFQLGVGRNDAALKSFKQALALDSTYAAAHMGMATAAIASGESDAALVALKQAIKYDPKNPDAPWMLAKFYDEVIGNAKVAAQAYHEFAQIFPKDPRAAKANERADALAPKPAPVPTPAPVVAPVTTNIVEAAGAEKPPPPVAMPAPPRPTESKIKYKHPVDRNTKAAVQAFNQGTRYQDKNDWDRAIYYYLRSLENDDKIASTFYNLGVAYSVKGETGLAKEAYLRALDIQPDMINARYNLALAYRDGRDTASATKLLEDIVKARPDHAQAHYVLGLIYSSNPSTFAQAKDHYQAFLKLAPNDPAAANARKWVDSH